MKIIIGATIGILSGAMLAGGVALASIPAEDGVINGCRHNATGAVRIVDAPDQDCGQVETAISWNHQGPVGPQGPAGPRGQQGKAGPPGVAAALTARSGPVDIANDGAFRTVVSKRLPAGTYAVMGGVVLRELSGFAAGDCQLRAGAKVIDKIRTQFDGFNEQNEYSLFGTVGLADPGILRLMCREHRSSEVAAMSSRLLAIEVTAIG